MCILACVRVCAVRTWVCPAQGYCDSVTQAFLHMLVDLRMCGFCGRLSPVSLPLKTLAKRNVVFTGYGCPYTDDNDIGVQDEVCQGACGQQPDFANEQVIHLGNHRGQIPPAPAPHSHLTYRLSNNLRVSWMSCTWQTLIGSRYPEVGHIFRMCLGGIIVYFRANGAPV